MEPKKVMYPLYILFMLFGMSGRLNRAKYWVALAITVLLLMPALVLLAVKPPFFRGMGWINLASLVLGSWAWSAILVKRLHDFNWSGWWWWLIGLFPIAALGIATQVAFSRETKEGQIGAILVGIIIIAILGAAKGTVGANKYGPDPRGSADLAHLIPESKRPLSRRLIIGAVIAAAIVVSVVASAYWLTNLLLSH